MTSNFITTPIFKSIQNTYVYLGAIHTFIMKHTNVYFWNRNTFILKHIYLYHLKHIFLPRNAYIFPLFSITRFVA